MGRWTGFLKASKILSRKGLKQFLTERLELIPPGAKALNVGSGGEIQAIIETIAARKGFTVTSTDVDPIRKPDVVDDITRSSFPDASFDAVIMMEVLEHVTDPQRAALEIHRLLKPGGALILSAPFIFPLHDRPYDFYRFTKYGLAHLFKDFDDLVVRERNNWMEAILVLLARTVADSSIPKLASAALLALAFLLFPLAILIGKLLPSDFLATGYVISAKKSLTPRHSI